MSTVDLSERDNKETLFVKEEVTNDAEVFGEVVLEVAGLLKEKYLFRGTFTCCYRHEPRGRAAITKPIFSTGKMCSCGMGFLGVFHPAASPPVTRTAVLL